MHELHRSKLSECLLDYIMDNFSGTMDVIQTMSVVLTSIVRFPSISFEASVEPFWQMEPFALEMKIASIKFVMAVFVLLALKMHIVATTNFAQTNMFPLPKRSVLTIVDNIAF